MMRCDFGGLLDIWSKLLLSLVVPVASVTYLNRAKQVPAGPGAH